MRRGLSPSLKKGGCGGVFRDYIKRFLVGFNTSLVNGSLLVIELHAISIGLNLAAQHKFDKVMMESDLQQAVELIHGHGTNDHQLAHFLDDIKAIANGLSQFELLHILCEVNALANSFAKYGICNM